MFGKNNIIQWAFAVLVSLASTAVVNGQEDSTARKKGIDSFLLKQKGIIGHLAENLLADTSEPVLPELQRNDLPFQRYRNRVIRHIYIDILDFGVSIKDTSKKINTALTRLADNFHRKSRNYVIRNNLFFKEKQRLSPYLLGDNERHLRDLPFLADARIIVKPVSGTRDSVDVIVFAKDVLSIGGSARMHNMQSGEVALREDNFMGWGDRLQVSGLYDNLRHQPLGYGAEYISRNIGGSFIDARVGYQNFAQAFSSGNEEEDAMYFQLLRPLVNPYMRWTYSLEAGLHTTKNMYVSDSLYQSDLKYQYNIIDAWAGWNMSADRIAGKNPDDRLRRLLSARILDQQFSVKPDKYLEQYYYRYADITAILGTVSLFKQDFYRTQYIYGFGRNEDVPEGMDISLTGGYTIKNKRKRSYAGLDFQRYYFSGDQRYFNYTARVGAFLYGGKVEDIDVLGNLDYFSRLIQLGPKWKHRLFLSTGISRQYNTVLNEPLMLESSFGLPGYRNKNIGGDIRVSGKAESVFFSPWSVLLFKFAPFVFANATLFRTYIDDQQKWYSAIGGGIRTRNESLIFGTIEIRASYFPRKTIYGDTYRIDFNTNIRFKYNRQFIRPPAFVAVN